MATNMKAYIKFKNQQLSNLRNTMLKDLSKEHYACLIGKTNQINNQFIINIHDIRYPKKSDYLASGMTNLRVNGEFTGGVLNDIESRFDVDTIIEVHTHPFSKDGAFFSRVDNDDEVMFSKWMIENYPDINYGSIVFSQSDYLARMWVINKDIIEDSMTSYIKTQSFKENIRSSSIKEDDVLGFKSIENIYNRSILALGKETIKAITSNQTITIIGVGGIGSVVAEHLVHMGFQNINLIDHDKCEVSNLNRVVGLTYQSAIKEEYKVDVIKRHILSINPNISVHTYPVKVESEGIEVVIASSDWVVLATDNHYSRFLTQKLCFKYYVPFISVGVNITVIDEKIEDMSGEVITIRMGDGCCLSCLRRLIPNEIAKELSNDPNVKKGLINKGYVQGSDIKDPAIKTLNSIMGSLLVDVLINQYTENQEGHPIVVYENNEYPTIYYDEQSLRFMNRRCSICDI